MDGERPEVSVVIPVFNAEDTLAEQMDALFAQDFEGAWEIVVSDNGSTDGTAAVARRYADRPGPPVRVVDSSAVRGVNAARNGGVRAARGTKILFCDGDDVVEPAYVREMAKALDAAHGAAGVMEFRRLNPHQRDRPPLTGFSIEGGAPTPVGAVSGWRRETFDIVGEFDETWTSGCDDIEFAFRAHRAGLKVVEAPGAVMHKRERAGKVLFRQFMKYGAARPRLCRAFPDLAERRSTRAAARHWIRLLKALLRGRATDATIMQLGKNTGRLIGSVRHRFWAP